MGSLLNPEFTLTYRISPLPSSFLSSLTSCCAYVARGVRLGATILLNTSEVMYASQDALLDQSPLNIRWDVRHRLDALTTFLKRPKDA